MRAWRARSRVKLQMKPLEKRRLFVQLRKSADWNSLHARQRWVLCLGRGGVGSRTLRILRATLFFPYASYY
jgi:hypothetical protein